MAITKKDLHEYRDEKTAELERLKAEKETAKGKIEEKVKEFRRTLDDDFKAEFDPKESSIQGSIKTLDTLIERAGDDDEIKKEDL